MHQAFSDLIQEGDNAFISIPLSSPNVASSLWRYCSIVAVAQMWKNLAFIILFWARRRGVGDEGSDFFLTWAHQSGKKQRVDRSLKGALLGQLGNYRQQLRSRHSAGKRRSKRQRRHPWTFTCAPVVRFSVFRVFSGSKKTFRTKAKEISSLSRITNQLWTTSSGVAPPIRLGKVPTTNVGFLVVRRPSWDETLCHSWRHVS